MSRIFQNREEAGPPDRLRWPPHCVREQGTPHPEGRKELRKRGTALQVKVQILRRTICREGCQVNLRERLNRDIFKATWQIHLEVDLGMEKEQCGSSGLGPEPGASRSRFLLWTPSSPSSDGVLNSTSFSTKPESNRLSGWGAEEQGWFGDGLGAAGSAGGGACLSEESGGAEDPPVGDGGFSNQSGFWLMCWCMLQMET